MNDTHVSVKAAIIGASAEAIHTINKAHQYGIHIIALDGNPDAEGLKAADKALVVNISDQNATIQALKTEKPDFVLTVPIGRYLTTVGAVNDVLKLSGISENMAILCTDKYRFHEVLNAKGLRNCHCYRVGDEWSEDMPLEFPAILKPRFGSGSRGIHFLHSKEEIQKTIPLVEGEEYVLEECVDGEEYGMDGAVINNRFYPVLLRKKENTPPPARQAVGYFSVQPTDVFYGQVKEYMENVIQCLGLQECLLHTDIIRSKNGPFVIELSARPSGHNLHNLFTPLCTGVDMAKEYIKYRLGLDYCFEPQNTKTMLIHYFDMEGCVTNIPSQEEVEKEVSGSLIQWKCTLQKGDILSPVSDGHSVMGRGFFILESKKENEKDSTEELKSKAENIKAMFFQ